MSASSVFDLLNPTAKKADCKGLVFRGYRNMFMSDGKIELKQGIRLLKRKSCNGCQYCVWWWDSLGEDVPEGNVIFPEIEDYALYSIRAINQSIDWETGYADGYDTEIYKLENEDK